MAAYIFRRLLFIVPTLLLVMAINFVVIQMAPGGPIEQALAHLEGFGDANIERVTQAQSDVASQSSSPTRGSQGLREEYIAELRQQYGFDKPLGERFGDMVSSYARFDFGDSYFKGRPVIDLIIEKMPVSVSLGLWSTLIIYLISIPMGIRKAVRDGERFDVVTSVFLTIFAAIPSFLFAVLLLVVFAGGVYFDWFPLRGLVSDNFEQLSLLGKILDYFWHLVLPVTAISIGGFAGLTMLTKNSFLDQLHQQYVLTARAKGLDERAVMYRHVFRNAMLIIIAGFPAAFVGIFFTGALFIEIIFSLNGLGLLGYEAALARDYPVMFGTLWIFTLIGLLLQLVTDIVYTLVDPRIDFNRAST